MSAMLPIRRLFLACLFSLGACASGCGGSVGAVATGLSLGSVLDRVDSLVQNAIETADSRAARQQGMAFAGISGTVERVRVAYANELDRTIDSFSRAEQQTFRDIDATVTSLIDGADGIDQNLEERIRQMQSAMNQVLTRLPLTNKTPVLLTVSPAASTVAGAPDVVIYGYLLGNDLDAKLKPTIRLNGIDMPGESISVDADRVNVRVPAALKPQVQSLFSACEPVRELTLEGTFRYRTGGVLGMGKRVRKVDLRRTIQLPQSLYARVEVSYQPITNPTVSDPIPFHVESPNSFKAGSPGPSGRSRAIGELVHRLPDDAANIMVPNYGWCHVAGSASRRMETDAPVVTSPQISLKGRIFAERRWGDGVWGHLFMEGTYTRPGTAVTQVADRTFESLAFIRNRATASVSSGENALAKVRSITVALYREGCSEPADRTTLTAGADGAAAGNSERGMFKATLIGAIATIELTP